MVAPSGGAYVTPVAVWLTKMDWGWGGGLSWRGCPKPSTGYIDLFNIQVESYLGHIYERNIIV